MQLREQRGCRGVGWGGNLWLLQLTTGGKRHHIINGLVTKKMTLNPGAVVVSRTWIELVGVRNRCSCCDDAQSNEG